MKNTLRVATVSLVFAATASAQTPAGGEFRVNSYTTGYQAGGTAAMAPNGDYVVVWESYGQDGDRAGTFGQRFSAAGAARGSEFAINTYTTRSQGQPIVASGRRGDFVVAWENDDASGTSVRARRFDAAGSPTGADFLVHSSTTAAQYNPSVGAASDLRFVVSWNSQSIETLLNGSGFVGIGARRFDASGNAVGSDFLVNTYTTGAQTFSDVAVEPGGAFVVVWEDLFSGRDGSGSGVFAQRHDASGNRLGTEFLVNSYTPGDQRFPSVSMSPTGGFVVVWASPDGSSQGVFGRRFDPSGNALGSDFLVNTYTTDNQFPAFKPVAHDSRGNFIVAFSSQGDGSQYGAVVQRFNASGVRRGAEFRVNTYTTDNQGATSVAADSVGNFVVAWDSNQDGSDYGIFAQRFGGLGPFSLAVDGTGNQVLEPGETVDVWPSWRNFNGAAQTFGGTLTNITGPAGATHTITDAAGNYGTVADGATGPCIDCYAVSVSNPATRPVVHWDAAAVESILPDTQGQQKQWLLHVGRSFTDMPATSPFYRFVETLLHHGVTGGCSPTQYCPVTATTRDQMAVFVLVAKEGTGYLPPACTTPVFADVPASSPFCRWIEELARRAVVGGCGGGSYCPASAVTREQMAIFVLRTLDPALNPPACGVPVFTDLPAGSPFCRWVEELARRGVVSGCGGGNYCPAAAVTREQMGVFMSATFGLALYGP